MTLHCWRERKGPSCLDGETESQIGGLIHVDITVLKRRTYRLNGSASGISKVTILTFHSALV